MSTWAAGEVGRPSILAFIFYEKKAKRKGAVTGFEEADPQCLPPPVHEGTETLKDNSPCLEGVGLWSAKARNPDTNL